jgi:hypothetical protein
MDLLTALMTAGKIPVMDIADPEARQAMFDTIASMPEGQDNPYDLSNPFPGFLDQVGDQIIGDIIEASEALPDFYSRFEGALAETGRLEAIRASGTDVLEKIYQSGDGSLEAAMADSFEGLKQYNRGMKELNLQEAEKTAGEQAAVNTAGDNLADSVENMNAGTEGLLNTQKSEGDRGVTNVQDATLTGNKNVADETIRGAKNTTNALIAGADDTLNTATDVAADAANIAGDGLTSIAGATNTAITDNKNQQLSGVSSIADVQTDANQDTTNTAISGIENVGLVTGAAIEGNQLTALDGIDDVTSIQTDALKNTTGVATTGLEDVANIAREGLAGVKDAGDAGIQQVYDAEIGASTGIRDTRLDNSAKLEGAQLGEAGLMGNQMRRMAMTGRRAAEDAYNQQMKGMRTMGIGQGTGSNMRSAFAQNRANQAQGMFAPMAQADATQLGMESAARLGRVESDNMANLDFSTDQGLSGVSRAMGLAGNNNTYASGIAGVNNQLAEGTAGVKLSEAATQGDIDVSNAQGTANVNNIASEASGQNNINTAQGIADANLASSATQGEINVGEAQGTANVLNDATAQTGQNNINTAVGQGEINNTYAGTVGDATNANAETVASANTALASTTGDANVNKAASDAAANINAETGFTQNQMDYLTGLIESNLSTNKNKVSADEIRLNNSLRQLGFTDPQIAALRTNLGYDLGESNQDFSNFNSLMNMRLGNLGMTANQASLMKYLAGAPTDIALGGLDPIARYSSPFTQRVMAPAHQSYINTSPYIPTATGGGGGSSFLDKFINFSNRYQNL